MCNVNTRDTLLTKMNFRLTGAILINASANAMLLSFSSRRSDSMRGIIVLASGLLTLGATSLIRETFRHDYFKVLLTRKSRFFRDHRVQCIFKV